MACILRGAGRRLLCTPPFSSLHKSQRLPHQVIYTLEDPRTNVVHYVGRTGNPERRYRGHLYPAVRHTVCTQLKVDWARELHELGLRPEMNVVEKVRQAPLVVERMISVQDGLLEPDGDVILLHQVPEDRPQGLALHPDRYPPILQGWGLLNLPEHGRGHDQEDGYAAEHNHCPILVHLLYSVSGQEVSNRGRTPHQVSTCRLASMPGRISSPFLLRRLVCFRLGRRGRLRPLRLPADWYIVCRRRGVHHVRIARGDLRRVPDDGDRVFNDCEKLFPTVGAIWKD